MIRYLVTKESGCKRFTNAAFHQIMNAVLNDDYIGSLFDDKSTFTPDYDFEEIEAETDSEAIEIFLENFKTTVSVGDGIKFQSYYLDKLAYEKVEDIYDGRDELASSVFSKKTVSFVLHYFARIENDFETYRKMILSKKIAQYDGIEEMLKNEWDFVEWLEK